MGHDHAMDFEAAGLLDGLDGHERDARVALLEQLISEGFSEQELRAAVAEDRLALVPGERGLGGRYTAAAGQERTGGPAPLGIRIRRLQGLPEPRANERA